MTTKTDLSFVKCRPICNYSASDFPITKTMCDNQTSEWEDDDAINVVQPVLGIMAFVGNTFTLIVALYTKDIRRKQSSYLIINLAIHDATIGILYVVYGIHNKKLIFFIESILICSSSITIMMIALERCFAVTSPFKHRRYVTKTTLIVGIILDWVVILCIVIKIKLRSNICMYIDLNLVSVCVLLSVTVLNALIYILIIITVRRNAKKIKNRGSVFKRNGRKQNIQMIKTFALVSGILILCCIPYSITYIISALKYFKTLSIDKRFAKMVIIVKLLIPLNSTVNMIIYWWRIPEFRMSYRRVFGRKCYTKAEFKYVMTIRSTQLEPA